MKEITENSQVYVVSDNYPKKPFVKYIKERGTPVSATTLEYKLDDLISALEDKGLIDKGAVAEKVAK